MPVGIAAFATEGTFTVEDDLIAGHDDLQSRQITLQSGQNLARGSLLGRVTGGGARTAATAFTGTGNGAITMDATAPVAADAVAGVYTATLITAVANGGTFRVERPDGAVLGDVAVGATFDDDIKFVIADGTTDFVVGDRFSITVSVAAATNAGKYLLALSAATDGSDVPAAILAVATDASAADKVTVAYFGGVFDENAVTYGTGRTAANSREALRDVGIKLQSSIAG